MMSEWSARRKKNFRLDVLTILAGRHLSQNHKLDDLQMCMALQSNGWDCEMKDVVTILQDMQGRNWVNFLEQRNPITRRVELYGIAILPDGQDLVDGITRHPAVSEG